MLLLMPLNIVPWTSRCVALLGVKVFFVCCFSSVGRTSANTGHSAAVNQASPARLPGSNVPSAARIRRLSGGHECHEGMEISVMDRPDRSCAV